MQQWLSWQWDSDLGAILIIAWLAYFVCWVRVRRQGNQVASMGRLLCWSGAVLTLTIALMSAIDRLSESFFSFHMLQHVLLIDLAPPLGLLGRPVSMLQSAITAGRDKSATAGYYRQNWLIKGLRFILKPVVAWGISTATLYIWHWPAAYNYALNHTLVHEFGEHLTMILAFLIWWHPLIGSLPEFSYLSTSRARFFYLAGGMISALVLTLIILFWPDVLYTYYLGEPGSSTVSVLTDQRIGGVIMMASSMAVLFFMGYPLQYFDKRPLSWP